ncbi:beta-N-acetylhexosaminidase [Pedobacter heparinus]|uniref:beta-N-acetylhexosaminidase n=1 Tax=Pedobacter heparinus (strain ATCC 13125 / DSM 2366 / CIP 104194 / JCM 7457 / NBRC 12017 / NCIMB 9290 / NRRL B-14731 / HIM 762-3) TaxID=485917 RepID=C6Y384_PEDHD|nr:beta-N-acetylhexosaminidase [Pedobacter heparinus]ACU05309.1 Glycoside hydrolase, family 20, catalytic core [Pedobacter heparinus DSM 2366]
MIRGTHILILLLLLNTKLFAADIPVVPYPQQVLQGTAPIKAIKNIPLKAGGIDQAMLKRLADVTKYMLTGKKTAAAVTLSLTGRDKETDARIRPYATKLKTDWKKQIGKEGYVLILNNKDQLLVANTETGLFYGLQTLKQLLDADWNKELVITDWPSLPQRVMFDDISRGPISKVTYIKEQIERMAALKVNGLSFYIEHVIQTKSYPDFAPADGKLTIADVKELDAYAAKYHMQLIGSFQSFGHFNNILSLPQYQSMGETSTMISPLDPKARQFLESVITEMCGAFSSPYFNVNCDETFDLGKGKSKKYTDSVGVAKFYADHLKFLYDVVKKNGKKLMMWGDIALQHEEILDMLPKDIVYMTWEYGDPQSYSKWIDPFVKRNLSFMVCPGILNTNRLFPDLAIAKANINGFIKEGYEKGTIGAYTTIWDEGGDQLFSEDWYGVYMAAEKSWNVKSVLNDGFDLRYEKTAYGTANGAYVKAIGKLMELRDLPLTYNMTHEIWWQHILPQNGETLILNNKDVAEGLRLVNEAAQLLQNAKPKRHLSDLATLKYIVDRYKLLFDTRIQIAELAKWYQQQQGKQVDGMNERIVSLKVLKNRYEAMEIDFRNKWNAENQPYTLDYALKPYKTRIAALTDLENKLLSLERPGKVNSLPAAAAVGLNVVESDQYYFNFWLLSGPFKSKSGGFPPFLYSEEQSANHPPKPGDFAQYNSKQFRWMKYNTDNGGIINKFKDLGSNAYVYAFCTISTETAGQVQAWIGNDSAVELFCNNSPIAEGNAAAKNNPALPKEKAYSLPLKAGSNYILLKVKSSNANAAFTFRLDTTEPVTNHKHKYTINANQNSHEAD